MASTKSMSTSCLPSRSSSAAIQIQSLLGAFFVSFVGVDAVAASARQTLISFNSFISWHGASAIGFRTDRAMSKYDVMALLQEYERNEINELSPCHPGFHWSATRVRGRPRRQ